jgi:hypothetical protein
VSGVPGRLAGHVRQHPSQRVPVALDWHSETRVRIAGSTDGAVAGFDRRAVVRQHVSDGTVCGDEFVADVPTDAKLTGEPFDRKISYPVTARSSVDGAHARVILTGVTLTATGVPGTVGGWVSTATAAAAQRRC